MDVLKKVEKIRAFTDCKNERRVGAEIKKSADK